MYSFIRHYSDVTDLIANDFIKVHILVQYVGLNRQKSAKILFGILFPLQNNTPGGSHYFDFGDINGDGRPDLALGAKGKPFDNGNYFASFMHPRTLKPWRKELLPNAGNQIGATVSADVNGDGKVDILASLDMEQASSGLRSNGLNMLLMLICCILILRFWRH